MSKIVSVNLPQELIEQAKAASRGNLSALVRTALEAYLHRQPTPAEIAAAIRTLAAMQEEATDDRPAL